MAAYYNEIDPYAAQWLRNLIAAGHIAPGDVDERSIEDVRPDELKQYTQCHFFAGVGVWSLALRRAGWSDDQPVWTGSCPCQPFSAAGKGAGFDDERHLWPAWFHLITQRQPSRLFGEQVASKDGLGWLDLVQTDLEAAGYAFGAVDLCAAGVGAPQIRQRSWLTAKRLGDPDDAGLEEHRRLNDVHKRAGRQGAPGPDVHAGVHGGLAHTDANGRVEGVQPVPGEIPERRRGDSEFSYNRHPGPTNGFWRAADWLFCRDGKWRVVEPGTFPLVDGAPGRVGRLRAYGNAINVEAAQTFIESCA